MTRARLVEVDVPNFDVPDPPPSLPDSIYHDRLASLRLAMEREQLDVVVVYADREHSASLSYLTGFDPRFEEALLIVGADEMPLLLVGNECVGMAEAAPLPLRVELFQLLSLPNQPADRSRSLRSILTSEGVTGGAHVGMVGWKGLPDRSMIDVPAFITDPVRHAVESAGSVVNAGALFNDPADGLRVISDVDQLAVFEYAACHTSDAVRRVIKGIEPGMTEIDAVRLLQWNGQPLSCHLMLTAGPRARLGLLSPSDRRIRRGDPFTIAYGIWGALNCRAGFVVEGASELSPSIADYVDVLVGPYFEAIAAWYESLRVGQTGGVLFEAIHSRIGDPFFGLFLNPGHQIHLDEWVNSPVWKDSPIELQSGMTLQADVIPATGTEYFTTNIEDGLAIADAGLRRLFARRYPEAWARIVARRTFMRDTIGIELHEDVLPFSNTPTLLAPFLLAPDLAMTIR